MLKPLKKLSLYLERDDSLYGNAFIMIEKCGNELRNLVNSDLFKDDDAALCLYNVFVARMRSTAIPEIICLAGCLTAQGRAIMLTSKNGIISFTEEDIIAEIEIDESDLLIKNDELIDRIIKDEFIRTEVNTDTQFDSMWIRIIDEQNKWIEKRKKEKKEIPNVPKNVRNVFQDPLSLALEGFRRYRERLGLDFKKTEKEFKKWLNGDFSELSGIYLSEKTYDMWKILATDRFTNLSEIALRLSTIPCSEACVERMFSAHRRVTAGRWNTEKDLLHARMILLNSGTFGEDDPLLEEHSENIASALSRLQKKADTKQTKLKF